MNFNFDKAAVLVAVLNCLGAALKAHTGFPNQWIPLVLICAGVGACGLFVGWHADSAIMGAVAGLTAIGAHKTFQNSAEILKPKTDEEPKE